MKKNRIRELRAEKEYPHNFASVWAGSISGKPSVRTKTESICQVWKSLIKMADIFHVSTDYLIGRSDVRKPSATKSSSQRRHCTA